MANRQKPIDRQLITGKIYTLLRDNISGEIALTVSLQLQEYGRLKELENKYNEIKQKTDGELLRELAERLDEQEENFGD